MHRPSSSPTTTRRRRLPVLALLGLVAGTAVVAPLTATVASAETSPLPVTVTASPTTNVVDGTTVTIDIDAQSPPNAAASQIFGAEARLCEASAAIDFSADFNPTQTGKCVLHPLSANSDAKTEVVTAPPNLEASFTFRVGIGSDTFETQFNGSKTIQCGPSHPCKLVVKLQVPGTTAFTSFPIEYQGAPADEGTTFHPVTPKRILDSRPGGEQVGPYGTPWGAGTSRDVVVVGGTTTIPTDAKAVVVNATVTGSTAGSFLTVWPKGASQPTASNLNWAAGQSIPNAITVKVGTDGQVSVYNNSGNVNVIFDVVGWYDEDDGGAGFTSLAPKRILDSRPGGETVGPYNTPWAAGTERDATVAGGTTGVPAGADAVVLNVTATGTSAESFLSIWPKGDPKPTASNLNWKAGQTIPNAVTVKVGTGDQVSIFNNSGNVNVIIDVVGYFDTGSGDRFFPLDPARIQDSRPGGETVGPYNTPWGAGTARTVAVTEVGGVPAGATSVLTNVTVTATSAESFLTVWPTGETKPTASALNWGTGVTIANAVTAKVGTGGSISVFNNSGTVNVIADVAGWYGPPPAA